MIVNIRKQYQWLICLAFVYLCLAGCTATTMTFLGLFDYQYTKKEEQQEARPIEESEGVFIGSAVEGGMIEGVVVSTVPELVEFAMVSFTQAHDDPFQEKWTSFNTDKQGNFKIQNIPFGEYKIASMNMDSFLTVEPGIQLSVEQPVVTITLTLEPAEFDAESP